MKSLIKFFSTLVFALCLISCSESSSTQTLKGEIRIYDNNYHKGPEGCGFNTLGNNPGIIIYNSREEIIGVAQINEKHAGFPCTLEWVAHRLPKTNVYKIRRSWEPTADVYSYYGLEKSDWEKNWSYWPFD